MATSLGEEKLWIWTSCIYLPNSSAKVNFLSGVGMMFRVFANGLGDLGSIPGCVMPKTQKMILDAALLNTQHYKVRIKYIRYLSRVKWGDPGKGVAPSPPPWCSSYWKGSLRFSLDYGRQLSYSWFEFSFPFPRVVALPKLKN